MSGISQQNHMKFPKLPDDLSIGDRTLKGKRSAVFMGIVSSESPTDIGIPPGKVNITDHDNGIRLKSYENKAVMDIHNAQLIGLNIETQIKSFEKKRSVIFKVIYKVLAMITLGAMVLDLSEDPSTRTREVAYLVIDFWDSASGSAQKILIAGKKKQIQKFLALFD
jgi:hypothetical protein